MAREQKEWSFLGQIVDFRFQIADFELNSRDSQAQGDW
jgi:hypothetical protein